MKNDYRMTLSEHHKSFKNLIPPTIAISIVIPTYNKAEHLARLLPSLLAQRFDHQSFEIIIVDDGSTDTTPAIAELYKDQFPHYTYIQQKNAGIGSARNAGLMSARGELVSFLADDYVLDPEYLTKMSSAFTDPEIHGIRPLFSSLGKSSVEMAFQILQFDPFKQSSQTALNKIYRAPIPFSWGGASMTRRQVFDDFGPFHDSFSTGEDSEYAWRLAKSNIHIHIFDEVLFQIKNRTSFLQANRRLYEYAFNGVRMKRQLGYAGPLSAKSSKPPLALRLMRLVTKPIINSFRHTGDFFQALRIIPVAYCMTVVMIFGLVCGRLSVQKQKQVSCD